MFDYKQRPFAHTVTDAEYDRAVGRTPRRRANPMPRTAYGFIQSNFPPFGKPDSLENHSPESAEDLWK